jgi:hypothetical protein
MFQSLSLDPGRKDAAAFKFLKNEDLIPWSL